MPSIVSYPDEVLQSVKKWFAGLLHEGRFTYNVHTKALFHTLAMCGAPSSLVEAEVTLKGVIAHLSKLPPGDPSAVIANKLLRKVVNLRLAVVCARSRAEFSLVDGKTRDTAA